MDPKTTTEKSEAYNHVKELIEAIRKTFTAGGLPSEQASIATICTILDEMNDRLAALEQEVAPGNAFIQFHPSVTATPLH